MKILITGTSGLLGSALMRSLQDNHEVVGLSRSQSAYGHKIITSDITDQKALYQAVTRVNPDIVIHSAAQSNVDECERDPDSAYKINAIGTRNVALACQRFDATLAYISTDYVFSGNDYPKDGYTEFDKVNPLSAYGKSKLEGEQFVRHLLNKFYIIRTSWLFGSERSNLILQTAQSLQAGKDVKSVSDMVSCPTYVNDAAEAIGSMIESSAYGTYHITNSGFASRFEIGQFISELMNCPQKHILKLSQKDLNLPALRPKFSAMNNYAWKLSGFAPLRNWKDAVKEFLKEQKYI